MSTIKCLHFFARTDCKSARAEYCLITTVGHPPAPFKGGVGVIILILFFVFCNMACNEQTKAPVVLETQMLPHPRLLFTAQDEKQVKIMRKSIPLVDSLCVKLTEQAENLLSVPVQEFKLSSLRQLLGISREQVSRIITLSMAYRLTGDKRFAQKAEEELVNVCNYPDWNPYHFLDVAEMATAVGIGYDWLYEVLKPETKRLIIEKIKKNAIDEAFKVYEKKQAWHNGNNNWNVVCNTGMVIGALAIAEDYPEEAGKVVQMAAQNVPNCMRFFAPDGACYEGPAYWGYANSYLAVLCRALTDNFKHDFGLSAMEGINNTALYFIRTFSPAGRAFNFADSAYPTEGSILEYSENPLFFYLSHRFEQPEVAAHYRKVLSGALKHRRMSDRFFFLSIPWFDNAAFNEKTEIPKMQVFRGKGVDILVFNGNRQVPNAIHLIAKSGSPSLSHQQLDVGTFVTEVNGIRWSDDLGSDSYALPGFWENKPDGQRWTYFRNTNFSHNTLTIDGKIQYAAGEATLAGYDAKAKHPYATIDMTPVYKDQASFVHRTFSMADDVTMSVKDSVVLLTPGQTVQWTLVTKAGIRCDGKVATLSKDGQTFYVKIISPGNAVFTSSPAKTSFEGEKSVEGFNLLKFTVSGSKTQVIQVTLSSNNH